MHRISSSGRSSSSSNSSRGSNRLAEVAVACSATEYIEVAVEVVAETASVAEETVTEAATVAEVAAAAEQQ